MSAGARLALFAAGLLVLAGLAFGLGRLLEIAPPVAAEPAMDGHGAEMGGGHAAIAVDPVRGLGVAEHGLRLVVADAAREAGVRAPLRFRILDEDGGTVRDFDELHTKRMHLIVVRRDLTGFQHLHPELSGDGTWSTPLRLDAAGSYRVFADFSHDGEPTTLASDLAVDGEVRMAPLPPASATARSEGGYEVVRSGRAPRAGEEAALTFAVSRDGEPVALRPYLGAGGHLVALREGDLAFLHVHPIGDAGKDGSVTFDATFPTAGRYRLFLQFEAGGEVRTAAFTEEVS